jgi:hypothetical protein
LTTRFDDDYGERSLRAAEGRVGGRKNSTSFELRRFRLIPSLSLTAAAVAVRGGEASATGEVRGAAVGARRRESRRGHGGSQAVRFVVVDARSWLWRFFLPSPLPSAPSSRSILPPRRYPNLISLCCMSFSSFFRVVVDLFVSRFRCRDIDLSAVGSGSIYIKHRRLPWRLNTSTFVSSLSSSRRRLLRRKLTLLRLATLLDSLVPPSLSTFPLCSFPPSRLLLRNSGPLNETKPSTHRLFFLHYCRLPHKPPQR